MHDVRIRELTQQGQTGTWVEIDDVEQIVYVDIVCTDVPDLKSFVHNCHELAGNLGYGIVLNERAA